MRQNESAAFEDLRANGAFLVSAVFEPAHAGAAAAGRDAQLSDGPSFIVFVLGLPHVTTLIEAATDPHISYQDYQDYCCSPSQAATAACTVCA